MLEYLLAALLLILRRPLNLSAPAGADSVIPLAPILDQPAVCGKASRYVFSPSASQPPSSLRLP